MDALFTFSWDDLPGNCSANDAIRHWLKDNGYEWQYDSPGRIIAELDTGKYYLDHVGNGKVVAVRA